MQEGPSQNPLFPDVRKIETHTRGKKSSVANLKLDISVR